MEVIPEQTGLNLVEHMIELLIAYFYEVIECLNHENSDFEIQPAML